MAPRDGFEPPTNGLTVRRSTTELPGNSEEARIVGKPRLEVKESGVAGGQGCHGILEVLRRCGALLVGLSPRGFGVPRSSQSAAGPSRCRLGIDRRHSDL